MVPGHQHAAGLPQSLGSAVAWVVPNQVGSQEDPSLNGKRCLPSSHTLSHGLQTTWGENCLSNLNYYHLLPSILAPTRVGPAWFNNGKQSGKVFIETRGYAAYSCLHTKLFQSDHVPREVHGSGSREIQ